MVRFCCARTLVALAVSFSFAADAQTKKTFPTDDEITLVLTQTERAMQQYKPLIDQQTLQIGKIATDAGTNDRQVVSALETAVKMLRGHPQGFNGPLGFNLFEWLDDASRNAALCAGGSLNQVTAEVIAGNRDKLESLLRLGQACTDASTLIYTVSENAGSLYQRYVMAERDLASQAAEVAQHCTNILRKNSPPTKK